MVKIKHQGNSILLPKNLLGDYVTDERDTFTFKGLACNSCCERMELEFNHITFDVIFKGDGEWIECNLCGEKNFLTKKTVLDIIRGI